MDSLVIASVLCVANAKMQDTTYEVARDIVLNTLEEYKNQIDTLNKGIDELTKKYQDYVNSLNEQNENYENDISKVEYPTNVSWKMKDTIHDNKIYIESYKRIIQDLKKLKGE